jgi:hypothetical protein
MGENTALLIDELLPHQPMRQWVLIKAFLACCQVLIELALKYYR